MISIAVSLAGSGIVGRVSSLLCGKFIPNNKKTVESFLEIIGSSITSITKKTVENFLEIIGLSITSITKKCYWCYRLIDKSVKVFFPCYNKSY